VSSFSSFFFFVLFLFLFYCCISCLLAKGTSCFSFIGFVVTLVGCGGKEFWRKPARKKKIGERNGWGGGGGQSKCQHDFFFVCFI
jgi:hypothetical protein